MPMEEAQVEKLRNWFDEHGWPICLRCNLQPGRDAEWDIGDIVSLIPAGGDETGPRYEVVFVACGHCGYVAQYMAQTIGLKAVVPEKPAPQAGKAPDKKSQPAKAPRKRAAQESPQESPHNPAQAPKAAASKA